VPLHAVPRLGLDHHRDFGEPRVLEEAGEGVEADLPVADVGVAVAPRVEGAQRVVEVQAAQGREADPLLDLRQHLLVALRLVEGVAGGEGVAGVETDPHPPGLGHPVADGRQVLQPVAQAGPLARRVLQQNAGRSLR